MISEVPEKVTAVETSEIVAQTSIGVINQNKEHQIT